MPRRISPTKTAAPATLAIGIDPGTRRIGYGLVKKDGPNFILVEAGLLPIASSNDIEALAETKRGLDRLLEKFRPAVLGIEKLYFAKNQKTAIAVAQARGVLLLSAKEHAIPVREYTPNEVKLGVTGYGAADKNAVLKMVRLTLGERELAVIDDASDALALAIMALGEERSRRWITGD